MDSFFVPTRPFGSFWGTQDLLLEVILGVLEGSWELLSGLGRSRGGLRASWESLGRPWGAQGSPKEPFWSHFRVVF